MSDQLTVLHNGGSQAASSLDGSSFLRDWRNTVASPAVRQAVAKPTASSQLAPRPNRISGTVGQSQKHTVWVPTTELSDRLDHRLFELKVQTGAFAMHLSSDWRSGLFRQLDRLLSEENWEPIDELPQLSSYLTAIRLLIFLKKVERPGIGLNHEGNVLLTWSSGNDHLTIECRANDAVRWIVSNTLEDGTRERAAGDSTAKRIPNVIAAYEPSKWLNPQ